MKPILIIRTTSVVSNEQYKMMYDSVQNSSVSEDYHVLVFDGQLFGKIEIIWNIKGLDVQEFLVTKTS
jgi:hypothetical protein